MAMTNGRNGGSFHWIVSPHTRYVGQYRFEEGSARYGGLSVQALGLGCRAICRNRQRRAARWSGSQSLPVLAASPALVKACGWRRVCAADCPGTPTPKPTYL